MQQLVLLLTQLLNIYKKLLQTASQKKEILIKAQTEDLEQLTKLEEGLVRQAEELAGQRRLLMRRLFPDQPDRTLTELQTLVPESLRPQFAAIGQEFSIVLTELQQLNAMNNRLIQQSLGVVRFSINLLSQNTAGPTYAPQGEEGVGFSRTFFDHKV